MSNGTVTITIEEYRRLQKIEDSVNYCLGVIEASNQIDKTKKHLRVTLATIKDRLAGEKH